MKRDRAVVKAWDGACRARPRSLHSLSRRRQREIVLLRVNVETGGSDGAEPACAKTRLTTNDSRGRYGRRPALSVKGQSPRYRAHLPYRPGAPGARRPPKPQEQTLAASRTPRCTATGCSCRTLLGREVLLGETIGIRESRRPDPGICAGWRETAICESLRPGYQAKGKTASRWRG